MNEPMPYGEAVQELTHLRAQYEQFIIDRERERIIKLLKDAVASEEHSFCYVEDCWCGHSVSVIELIKGETK